MASIIKANELQDFNGNAIITSDGSGNVTVNAAAMKATPAFHAYLSATQEPSNDTTTVVQFNTESLDTDSAYDNSTYRFIPQTSGKYFVYAQILHNPSSSNNIQQANIQIRKNGSAITKNQFASSTNPADEIAVCNQIIVDLNGSTDYVDVVGLQAVSSGTNRFSGDTTESLTYFGAYKIIGA